MNEYIKNDKRKLIFFLNWGEMGDWNVNAKKMLHPSFHSYLLIVK